MSAATKQSLENLWTKVHSRHGYPFPQTVAALTALHVTRYHVDYVGHSVTSYVHSPGSEHTEVHTSSIPDHGEDRAEDFNVSGVQMALKKVQQGKLTYHEFAGECTGAGVVGYLTFINGKMVMYYGSKGEQHIEWFPGAGPQENAV